MKWQGKGVSEGLAMAKIHLFTPKLPEISRQPAGDPEAEVRKLEKTLAAAQDELHTLYETAKEKMGEKEAEIFDAHLTILNDEYSVREPIVQRIREQKQTAAAAISDQFDELAQMFRSLGDELMAERAADAEDLKQQLLRICLGCGRQDLSNLPGDVIVLAEELTPSDTVRMETSHVKGVATKLGGATAHSAIIARTLGIPAAAGVDGWQTEALDGHMAILDGADGSPIVDPTQEETDCYRCRKSEADCQAQALEAFRSRPSQTKDGAALEICANIGTPQEAQQAMEYGADGVGLFRSEFLFMDRDALPTEEEQFEAYRMAAQTMAGKPLIIRTLDVGGDKKLPTLELPHEENPFLGFRAIRMTLSHPEIFRPQLRAILRAAAYGDVRVMFPMIGAKVALLDITVDRVQALAEKLGLGSDRAFCAAVDVSDEASVKTTVDAIMHHFRRIDVLVNAAGIPGPSARVEDYSFSDAKKVINVNLFGTFLMMHTILPVMQKQKHGAVLNFGSVSGLVGYPFESAYGASKAAIIHLTKNAASENGGNGVRINCILPGGVKTNMMTTILDSYKNVGFENASENVTLGPMGRPGTPEEIANVAAFICSEDASYANGSNFLVDGGMTLG